MPAYFWIALCIIVFLAVPFAVMYVYVKKIAKKEYEDKLTRTSPDKWGRENSCPENEEHSVMYDAGMDWAAKHSEYMTPVSVTSEDLKLKGEYYNFGSQSCAVIIPGRAESLNYSYFFARPYEEAGVNVLVIDTRAHGLSEGKYVGMGIGEIPDVIAWSKLLRDDLGVKKIILHGICIGSSTAVMASVRDDCPEIAGIVAEGIFASFYTIFKQRTKNSGHPAFPFMWMIYKLAKKNAGVDIIKQSPKSVMDRMTAPVLFLHSRKDNASLPKYAEELFDACSSAKKKLVWFEEGVHSHIRIACTEKYDGAIRSFLEEIQ